MGAFNVLASNLLVSCLPTDDTMRSRMDALMGGGPEDGDALLVIVDCQKGFLVDSSLSAAARSIALGRRSRMLGYRAVVSTRLEPDAGSVQERMVDIYLRRVNGRDLARGVSDVSDTVLDHSGWSSVTNELLDAIRETDPARIDVCGVGTEHGVLTTALDLANEGLPVRVLARYCGSYRSRGGNRRALALMETLLGGESVYRGWVE